jgi:hypothetical protein
MLGSAHDPALGIESGSGVPFRAQLQQVQQGMSVHEYRRGKYAKFIEEIYKDWILPFISKEITKDQSFLATLSTDEMQQVAEAVGINLTEEIKKKTVLSRKIFDPTNEPQIKQQIKDAFLKDGNKKFIKILKNELKDIPLRVKVNVANKQKNLGLAVDKMSSVFQNIFSNPQVLAYPPAAKAFNMILENMGLSPIDFTSPPTNQPINQPAPQQPQQAPQQVLGQQQ